MIGQIIYLVILFLIVLGMYISYKRGSLIVNSVGNSIPVEFETTGDDGLPLITLTSCHGAKYTFLVDTGASANYIDARVLREFNEEERTVIAEDSFYGAVGDSTSATVHTLTFTHRNSKLTDNYLSTNMSAFDRLKDSLGKEVHGVLGNPFLRNHGFTLDVNRMMVWKTL